MVEKKKEVFTGISNDKIKLFYDLIFWLGMIFLAVSYFIEEWNVLIIGIILLLLSLFIYELYHKPIKKKPYINLFYFLVSLLILYLLYLSREKLLIIFSRPFSSLLLFVFYSLAILILIVIIYNWIKGSKKTQKPKEKAKKKVKPVIKPVVKKVSIKPKKEIKIKKEKRKLSFKLQKFFKNLSLSFFILFLIFGIYILIPYLSYQQWLIYVAIVVIVFTVLLSLVYLYFKGRHKINQKIKEIKEKKEEVKKEEVKTADTKAAEVKQTHQTDFDVLYNMIQQKGKIKISQAAKIFNVNKKRIEEWAEILETHGLIKMHYPPVGEPELMKLKEK